MTVYQYTCDKATIAMRGSIHLRRVARQTHAFVRFATCVLAITFATSCDRSSGEVNSSTPDNVATEKPVERVVFPEEVHVDYAPINEFISAALNACVRGDYESFRLLWSAKQDPLRREEFEQGWRAVKTIRVRAVEKVVLPSSQQDSAVDRSQPNTALSGDIAPDVSFVLLASAEFDPNHPIGRRRPRRDFVLLILREQDGWRLGRASSRVREWVKSLMDDEDGSTGDISQPSSP